MQAEGDEAKQRAALKKLSLMGSTGYNCKSFALLLRSAAPACSELGAERTPGGGGGPPASYNT